MSLLFLIPLTIGLVTGYVSKCLTDEEASLLGLASAISLGLSLVLAPWQIQLLLLLLIVRL